MTGKISLDPTHVFQIELLRTHAPKTKIIIDLDNLPEYCGIKPDEVAINTWAKDKTQEPICADQLLELPPYHLESGDLDERAPIAFTFRGAVKLMVMLINRNSQYQHQGPGEPIPCTSIHELSFAKPGGTLDLLNTSLGFLKTKQPQLVPAPLDYDAVRRAASKKKFPYELDCPPCSASTHANERWDGVILRMLMDLGHILAYGSKDGTFWVKL